MKHLFTVCAVILTSCFAVAQHPGTSCRLDVNGPLPCLSQPGSYAECLRFMPGLAHPAAGLRLDSRVESPVGIHFQFTQTLNGVPVLNADVKVNVNHNYEVLSVFSNLHEVHGEIPAAFGQQAAYVVSGGNLIPANALPLTDGAQLFEDAAHNIVWRTLSSYKFMPADTMVRGKAFKPDPITTAGVFYGKNQTYMNFHDSDYALLNDQRFDVVFPATLRNDTFFLENAYSQIVNLAMPDSMPAVSRVPDFSFTRRRSGFKDVMATCHVFKTQEFIQSLGFTGLVNYPIRIDTHYGNTFEDSRFVFSPDTFLQFGAYGVPDAEDADVIVHEYMHAISHSITPFGVNELTARHVLEEANSDVMACVLSRKESLYNWRLVFNWDGHNEFWNGRSAGTPKTYDDYRPVANYTDLYDNSEIWSAAVCDIAEEIGEGLTMKLLLTSMFSYSKTMTMPDAAVLFMQADSILYGSSNSWKIGPFFERRKLLDFTLGITNSTQPPAFTINNTAAFASGTGDAEIILPANADVAVVDLQGRMMKSLKNMQGTLKLSASDFVPGMYVLSCSNHYGRTSCKLVR